MSNPPTLFFANEWYDTFYAQISNSLGYSIIDDERARDELSHLLAVKGTRETIGRFEKLRKELEDKKFLVFGAGPSLKDDILKLYPVARKRKNVVIAADGATDALLSAMIVPRITVSDLDSCSMEALIAQSEERDLFVHAHGDNINQIREIVPRLGRNIFGTTQVSSSHNVWNFGGFTDGDRACYIACTFEPSMVILAGMDFGRIEGEFSKSRQPLSSRLNERKDGLDSQRKKKTKLEFGKESLEFLIREQKQLRFVNATTYGEEILGVERLKIEELIEELS